MPTFDKLPTFVRDWALLSLDQKTQFMLAVGKLVFDIRSGNGFRTGLRVKGVKGAAGVYEMTWSDDGRATFEYGTSPHHGDTHILWRRVGAHTIFQNP